MLCMEICIHSGRCWGGRGRCREFPCSVVPALADTMNCFPPPITPLILLSAPERLSGGKTELGERYSDVYASDGQLPSPTWAGQSVSTWSSWDLEGIPPLVLLLLWGCFPLSGVGEERFQPLWWLLGWSASTILPPHSLTLPCPALIKGWRGKRFFFLGVNHKKCPCSAFPLKGF